jgi:hypothetical protein
MQKAFVVSYNSQKDASNVAELNALLEDGYEVISVTTMGGGDTAGSRPNCVKEGHDPVTSALVILKRQCVDIDAFM